MPGKVRQERFRRRVASKALSVSDSARLRLPVQATTGNVAEVRHRDFVNRPILQVRVSPLQGQAEGGKPRHEKRTPPPGPQ